MKAKDRLDCLEKFLANQKPVEQVSVTVKHENPASNQPNQGKTLRILPSLPL